MKTVLFFGLMLLIGFYPSIAQGEPRGLEIMQKAHQNYYYAGGDFKAHVSMKLINKNGKVRTRTLTMLRKNYDNNQQKYFIYFHDPYEVKGMAFMVWKYMQKNDDRWLFIPSIKLIRRIAASDKNSSFAGSDFTYEDVSGIEIEEETHQLQKEDTLNGKPVFVVVSTPKEKGAYTKRISYIDKGYYLPLKEEYYDQHDKIYRVFEAVEIKEVGAIPTITKRVMQNKHTQHTTEVTLDHVAYTLGLSNEIFSERSLKTPPKQVME